MNIPIFNTYIDQSAVSEITKLFISALLSEGEIVKQFEKQLELVFGFKKCITLNSGTSSLHLALVVAGIKEGDEVILPAQTFVATGLVILQLKAKPIFADIDYLTGNISLESIKSKITSKTKAIIPVHWGGYPCDLDEINFIAKENNIIVIEDAAHALGATYKNRPIGNISDFTCFSFQAIKHLTTGDGGAICTITNKYHEIIKKRWFGIDRSKSQLTELGERNYNINELGYKYHLNNYAATLGLANLKDYHFRLNKRIEIAKYYQNELSKINSIKLFKYKSDRQSAFWLFGFHVEKRNDFIRALKEKKITASVIHQRIDRNDVFGGKNNYLINQEKFDETQIHIPIHDSIDKEKAEYIVDTIRMGW
ncbi:MAG: hypothetical protein A2046_14215 [Bacteroidetes bacterium GWA2_30_7]|nr:MAG: hypothetical protein A2046_14215 [Bacteroidetes bacterium GWA2_30_7]